LQNWKDSAGNVLATVDDAGNVGIGTAAPSSKLTVSGEIKLAGYPTGIYFGNAQGLYDNGGAGLTLNVPLAASVMTLSTNDGNIVLSPGSGNVGIGTTGPSRKLTVSGEIQLSGYPTGIYFGNAQALDDNGGSGLTLNVPVAASVMTLSTNNGNIVLSPGSGNVGIGTAPPAEKLDVAGNIKSDGLNKIIFLRPLGPSFYDSAQINNEIAGLAATHGGIIMLEPGEYRINTTINLNVNGVKLRGYGGGWVNYPFEGAQATRLVWYGPSGSAVGDPNKEPHQAIVECRWDDGDTALQDLAISDLSILGNGRTNVTGLLLDHVSGSIFRNLEINDVTEGIWLTSTATAAHVDTDFNLFENCAVVDAQRGVVLTQNSVAAVNACHNTFIGLSIEFLGQEPPTPPPPDVDLWALAAGIHLVECDNNSFYRTWVYRQGGSAGHWVRIESPINARANYFYHLQGEIFVKNANPQQPPDNLTTVFGYDRENAQNPPRAKTSTGATVDVWNYVFWVDSHGSINNDDAQDSRGSVIARGYGRFASMKIGATEVISGARLLHNVTADAAILPLATETTRGAVTMSTETSSVACADDDSRLFDARTPTVHAGSHGKAGGDAITVEESQVTGLVTDLAAKVAGASGVASLRGGKATLSSGYVWVLTGLSSLSAVVVSLVVNGACPAEAVCAYWTTGGNFVINSSDNSSTSEVAWLAVGT
jgi:hypothetical protein